jgi:two-component system CheB/CheR fusion protein
MLATVQALAHQSCGRVGTPREAEELLNGRLMALSQAHEVLAEQNWRGAEIGQVLRRIVSLASHDPERIRIEGQPAFLLPPVAQSLAMAFYELSLNAMQYGALSSNSGMVGIDWKPVYRDGTTWLDIVWRETGGPAVEPPESHGLGVRLIRSMLPLEIAGKTEIEFPNDGVVCHIRIPMAGGLQ